MPNDTFDYVLSKVHDSLENQTTSKVKNRRSIQSVTRKHFWKQISLFLVLLLRCECPVLPIASCLLWLIRFQVFESQVACGPAPLYMWLYPKWFTYLWCTITYDFGIIFITVWWVYRFRGCCFIYYFCFCNWNCFHLPHFVQIRFLQ